MKHKTRIPVARMMNMVLCILIAGASAFLCGCAKTEALPPEAPRSTPKAQPASTDSPQPEVKKIISLSPPRSNEVQAAIARAYDGTVTANQNRFIVGDFDGDGSQDLVAVVKPIKAMLTKINSELARWFVKDPHKAFVPELSERMEKPSMKSDPVKVYQNDVLLVVLHGDGPMGWRNPQAMNTYLLKNAVGANINQQPFKEARLAIKSKDKPITLRGDVIKETLNGEQGFLYWTGAEYAWTDVKAGGRLRN
jgi:hypothetical protein